MSPDVADVDQGVFEVVFHPAMRDPLWEWAEAMGYEIVLFSEPTEDNLRTYLVVPGEERVDGTWQR
jgi:hypothetical protein